MTRTGELGRPVTNVRTCEAFERVPSPTAGMDNQHFHGAVTRIARRRLLTPIASPAPTSLSPGVARNPRSTPTIALMRSTFEAVAPYTTDAVYMTYLADEPERMRAAYGPNWEQLVGDRADPGQDSRGEPWPGIDPAE